jgi:hypothetical protein
MKMRVRSGRIVVVVALLVMATGLVIGPAAAVEAAPESPARGAALGAVRALHVVHQRDQQVRVAWSRPAVGRPTAYRVKYRGKVLIVPRTVRRVTLAGLPDGTAFPVTVRAVKRSSAGAARSVWAMAAGRPATPAAPSISLTDTPSGKAVSVSWDAVAPNGPGPVEYQVVRDGVLVACAWTTATNCTHMEAYDGLVHAFAVRARNAEETSLREAGTPGFHTSGWSATRPAELASTPDAMSIGSFVATGSNQEVRVSFTSGVSHGATNRVECTVNGATCAGSPWTYPVTGASDTKTLATSVPNGSMATIRLRACNGSSGSAQTGATCSAWVQAATTPYGPIGTPSISVASSSDHVVGSASWNANGKPVDVVITRNGSQIYSSNGVGSGSIPINDPIGYSQSGTYVITVSDTALWPGQTSARASKSASAVATTPPPGASVTVSKGASAFGQPGCTDPSCTYIVATTANFAGNVTCSVSNAYGGTAGFIAWTQAANQTKQSPDYYGWPSGWVEVTCNGVTSPRFYW